MKGSVSNGVLALSQHDVDITALHNHMLHGTPELYFIHFWAVGDPTKIAT